MATIGAVESNRVVLGPSNRSRATVDSKPSKAHRAALPASSISEGVREMALANSWSGSRNARATSDKIGLPPAACNACSSASATAVFSSTRKERSRRISIRPSSSRSWDDLARICGSMRLPSASTRARSSASETSSGLIRFPRPGPILIATPPYERAKRAQSLLASTAETL